MDELSHVQAQTSSTTPTGPPIPQYADVAVDVPTPDNDAFTYSIPPGLALKPGHLVRIPFGRRNVHGVVLRLTDEPRVAYTRPIHGAVYLEPLLTPARLQLAQWIAGYYRAPLFEALAPMLPPGYRRPSQTTVRLTRNGPTGNAAPTPALPPAAQRLFAYLHRYPRGRTLTALTRRLGGWAPNALRQLLSLGLAETGWTAPTPPGRRRVRQSISLSIAPNAALAWADERQARAPKQAALLRRLAGASPHTHGATELRREFGAATLQRLIGLGLVEAHEAVRTGPIGSAASPGQPETPLLPTQAQGAALQAIREAFDDPSSMPRTFLLHGVTGSGKTEVYLQAIAHCLASGKQAVVLVPELSLTPQTVARFNARFPGQVGVLHSGLTPAQQSDQWWRVYQGAYPVVIGSRGAVFAPQQELGLIVIDEEHEWTYKQGDASPRYHAREAAERIGELTSAAVLLGSATPDVADDYKARNGHYRRLALPHRIQPSGAPASLPPVEVVDMRQELRSGNRSIFGTSLQTAMDGCLRNGQQVILFLNRRGSAGVVQCRRCGFVARCWQCGTPYTYHEDQGLVCHHCNRRRRTPRSCPQCRSASIRYLGLGTQRVVDEAQRLFPGARVLRWDSDTAGTSRAHQRLMEQWAGGEADILVGTQMIAKGMHVPAVALVGAVLADVGLHVPDFRAAERTFQVLCQVAGRTGRGNDPGRVIIQTFLPDHYAVRAAAGQDYESFYCQEMVFRNARRYPPAGRLIRLLFTHADAIASRREANRMAVLLRRAARQWDIRRVDVVGPAPAYPPRLRRGWRWQLLLRGDNPRLLLDKVATPPNWMVDVDPMTVA